MDEIEKSFYSIGEVAEKIGEAPSLIRFWEKEFKQLKPAKTQKGTRKYSLKDIELIQYIHYLVKQKGYTIDGAREALKKGEQLDDKVALLNRLKEVRNFLASLKEKL